MKRSVFYRFQHFRAIFYSFFYSMICDSGVTNRKTVCITMATASILSYLISIYIYFFCHSVIFRVQITVVACKEKTMEDACEVI